MNDKQSGRLPFFIVFLGLFFTARVDAMLYDRGNGMIYDSDQNLTWLQDANYAYSSGYTAAHAVYYGVSAKNNIFVDGHMGWDAATAWANDLVYGGYSDWRLPTIVDTGAIGCDGAFFGTDCGYNVDLSSSEMAYMWYKILGNIAFIDVNGTAPQRGWGLNNSGPFINLQSYGYWSDTGYAPLLPYMAWYFGVDNGSQGNNSKAAALFAWAVRSGDVSPVPVPGAGWFLGSGLLMLVGMAGHRRRSRVS